MAALSRWSIEEAGGLLAVYSYIFICALAELWPPPPSLAPAARRRHAFPMRALAGCLSVERGAESPRR